MTDGRISESRIPEKLPCWNCRRLNLQKAFLTQPVAVAAAAAAAVVVVILHLTTFFLARKA
jgi:hypothetical protein